MPGCHGVPGRSISRPEPRGAGPEPRTPRPRRPEGDVEEELAAALEKVAAESEELDDQLVYSLDRASFAREQLDTILASLQLERVWKEERLREVEQLLPAGMLEELLPDDCTIASLERQLAMREEQQSSFQQQCDDLAVQIQAQRERCLDEAHELQYKQLHAFLGDSLTVSAEEVPARAEVQRGQTSRRGAAQPRQEAAATSARLAPKKTKPSVGADTRRPPVTSPSARDSTPQKPSARPTPTVAASQRTPARHRSAASTPSIEVRGSMPCLRTGVKGGVARQFAEGRGQGAEVAPRQSSGTAAGQTAVTLSPSKLSDAPARSDGLASTTVAETRSYEGASAEEYKESTEQQCAVQ